MGLKSEKPSNHISIIDKLIDVVVRVGNMGLSSVILHGNHTNKLIKSPDDICHGKIRSEDIQTSNVNLNTISNNKKSNSQSLTQQFSISSSSSL